MNPLAVESALKAALTPFFPSGVTIYTGTSYALTQPESLNIVAAVDDLQHQVAGFYLAEATIRLIGPALYGAQVFADMETAIATVQSALESPDFSAGWPSGSPNFGGLFVRTATSKQQGEQWDIEVSVRLGVEFI
jgi:hypothetical protein